MEPEIYGDDHELQALLTSDFGHHHHNNSTTLMAPSHEEAHHQQFVDNQNPAAATTMREHDFPRGGGGEALVQHHHQQPQQLHHHPQQHHPQQAGAFGNAAPSNWTPSPGVAAAEDIARTVTEDLMRRNYENNGLLQQQEHHPPTQQPMPPRPLQAPAMMAQQSHPPQQRNSSKRSSAFTAPSAIQPGASLAAHQSMAQPVQRLPTTQHHNHNRQPPQPSTVAAPSTQSYHSNGIYDERSTLKPQISPAYLQEAIQQHAATPDEAPPSPESPPSEHPQTVLQEHVANVARQEAFAQPKPAPSGGIVEQQPQQETPSQPQSNLDPGNPPPPPGPAAAAASSEVIDLLDSDDEEEEEDSDEESATPTNGSQPDGAEQPAAKRQRTDVAPHTTSAAAAAMNAYQNRNDRMAQPHPAAARIQPGATLPSRPIMHPSKPIMQQQPPVNPMQMAAAPRAGGIPPQTPYVVEFKCPDGFVPTWKNFLPASGVLPRAFSQPSERKYKLSLLNVNEFTIEGMPVGYYQTPTPIAGLGAHIRQVSRTHGKAVFDQTGKNEEGDDDDDEANGGGTNEQQNKADGQGKWRIPIGAYQSLLTCLMGEFKAQIVGIPQTQLTLATMEQARQAKGYPEESEIVSQGVPKGLAQTLAPFQRGGVDFVVAKHGRALIADEMGLGKTIQAIASMSVFIDEWPLLVLSPSSARYHWENEFHRWLGVASEINKKHPETPRDKLIRASQIHVLSSSKDKILPNEDTKVVICSYGLAPALTASGRLRPGLFQCAIVDESHMLKNMKTKRTKNLSPILQAAKRCVLLSGTPALAKPAELWPQLAILGAEHQGGWKNEADFMDRYVKKTSKNSRAELHALLTGTVMIRRLKNNILKDMKPKVRQQAQLSVITPQNHASFKDLLTQLKSGKGALAKLARTKEVKSIQADVRRQVQEEMANNPTEPESEEEEDDEEDETSKRANILSQLYAKTGEVKIPIIADMLNRWLDDPTKGKVCVFAHHLSVLNALRDICDLSNDRFSKRKYIRIDGATNPKVRQEQINQFQTDPTVRVALLGITAAGVAVTLTASSTVWFAELFWTPAIMIQAEDRAHRIGQQSQVEIVYFVGRGTLDDVLWKLVEKKFQNLGEFVEGKEKDKMVINKVYRSAKEFHKIFETKESLEEAAAEEEKELALENEFGSELVALDANLEHEIEVLGVEEQRLLSAAEAAEEEDDKMDSPSTSKQADSKPRAAPPVSASPTNEMGSSQEVAITLSDDEEEEEANPAGDQQAATKSLDIFSRPLTGTTFSQIHFPGPRLGLQLEILRGRAIVAAVAEERSRMYGEGSKPNVGDVMIKVNDCPLPHTLADPTGGKLREFIQNVLRSPHPTSIVFAENRDIKAFMLDQQNKKHEREEVLRAAAEQQSGETQSSPTTPDIIELLDD